MCWASSNFCARRTSSYKNNFSISLILLSVTFLFAKFKEVIKGTCFCNYDSLYDLVATKRATKSWGAIPEESFHQCIKVWQRKIRKCIRLERGLLWRGNQVVFVWNRNKLFVIPVSLFFRPMWCKNHKFPDFFAQAFKIVIDSWKFTMLLLYILWDD